MSAAPASIRAAMDSQNQCDSANTRLATPKMATAANITRPTWRWMGRADSHRPMATSPTVMDERSRPRPSGPTLSTSCAYTRSEEHPSELQSPCNVLCRLLLENTNMLPRHNAPLVVSDGQLH